MSNYEFDQDDFYSHDLDFPCDVCAGDLTYVADEFDGICPECGFGCGPLDAFDGREDAMMESSLFADC